MKRHVFIRTPARTPLTRARDQRTRKFTTVRANIESLLTTAAKWDLQGRLVGPDFTGLPSWWPFWSDVLKANVRDLVAAARVLATLEGVEL